MEYKDRGFQNIENNHAELQTLMCMDQYDTIDFFFDNKLHELESFPLVEVLQNNIFSSDECFDEYCRQIDDIEVVDLVRLFRSVVSYKFAKFEEAFKLHFIKHMINNLIANRECYIAMLILFCYTKIDDLPVEVFYDLIDEFWNLIGISGMTAEALFNLMIMLQSKMPILDRLYNSFLIGYDALPGLNFQDKDLYEKIFMSLFFYPDIVVDESTYPGIGEITAQILEDLVVREDDKTFLFLTCFVLMIPQGDTLELPFTITEELQSELDTYLEWYEEKEDEKEEKKS